MPQTHGQWLECAQVAHEQCVDGYGFDSGFGPPTGLAPHRSGALVCTDAQMHSVDVAQLSALDERCGVFDAQEPLGDGRGCATAIHRYCQDMGAVGGYGPVSVDGQQVEVVCLSDAEVFTVPEANNELYLFNFQARFCPPGFPNPRPNAVSCNAPVWTFCQDQGFLGGYGPLGGTGNRTDVVCVGTP